MFIINLILFFYIQTTKFILVIVQGRSVMIGFDSLKNVLEARFLDNTGYKFNNL